MHLLRRARPFAQLCAAILIAASAAGCVDKGTEHRVRANAFLRGGDAASALKECDLGLARKSGDLPLTILRAKALFELDRLEEAKASYEQALDLGKNQPPSSLAEANLGLAMVASRRGAWAEARKQFEALVAINEKDATSHLNVARVCLEQKDLPCAVLHGERAELLRSGEENVLFTVGTIYLKADRPKDAERVFLRICELSPAAATCPYGAALVAAKQGDKPRALAELQKAVDRKLPNPSQLAKEPGFASLRDDAEFKAIADKAAAAEKR
jgi:tetratricopeptide (TPR) repeat protein